MKADAQRVNAILGGPNQFLVPFFQRFYSWKRPDWERLWSDVSYLLGEGKGRQHFLGPLVLTSVDKTPREVMRHQIVDGQQRLTTLSLLLSALRDVAVDKGDKILAEKVEEQFLIHRHQTGVLRYRVVPRIGDREAFFQIVDGKWKAAPTKLAVTKGYQFFRRKIAELAEEKGAKAKLAELSTAVTTLLNLVSIGIEEENPYEIFETLNFLGQALKESDLIRNFVFMQIPQDDQQHFQDQHWQSLESLLDDAPDLPVDFASHFYRSYLMRNGDYIEKTGTFVAFKEQQKREGLTPEKLVAQLKHFAELELWLRRPDSMPEKTLRWPLRRIQFLDITTAHPLLLNLLDRFNSGSLDRDGLLQCVEDIASFVMRRSICGESSRTYGRWFTESIKKIQTNPVTELQAIWHSRKWPDDETFKARLLEFPLYHRERNKARLALEELERSYGHKESVDVATLTIEHVMPQTIKANASGSAWKKMLGANWEKDWQTWLHAIGNLTLSGYNEDMSNKPFDRKKGGLRESHLELNKHFSRLKRWDANAIVERGKELAKRLTRCFPKPKGAVEYHPSAEATKGDDDLDGGQKFRKDYWSRLNEMLKDRESEFVRGNITDASWQEFKTPSHRVRLWAKAYRNLKEVRLDMVFLYKLGRQVYEHLEEQKPDIERQFKESLIWEGAGRPFIAISREDADVGDEDSWDDQHDWLAEQLELIGEHLFPRIEKILAKLGPAGEEE